MPLWKVYHPAGAYTPEDKQAFAETMTEIYARFMPRFYVNVLFHEVDENTLYFGGKSRNNSVRITMAHTARVFLRRRAAAGSLMPSTSSSRPG